MSNCVFNTGCPSLKTKHFPSPDQSLDTSEMLIKITLVICGSNYLLTYPNRISRFPFIFEIFLEA